MANFFGTARSNYFRVKDSETFKAWVKKVPGLGVWETSQATIDFAETEEEKRRLACVFGIYSNDGDSGCWPSSFEDEEGEYQHIDLIITIAPYLADGQVIVMMETGAEKLRYVAGNAVAFDNTGKFVQVNLNDIYDKAFQAFGVKPTAAEY